MNCGLYLARTALVVGAIVLVDDDWVLHILHEYVLEDDVPDERSAGPGP